MIGIGINTTLRVISGGGGPSYDVDAQAFFDRVTTAGGTLTTTEKNATNQLVLDMKSAGIWSAMKAIYPMVGASAAACAQNLKSSSFTGTFTSGWTFASTGVTGNGTSAYMDTGLNGSTELSLNSNSFSVYLNNSLSAGLNIPIGNGSNCFIIPFFSSGIFNRNASSTYNQNLGTNNLGLFMSKRTSSVGSVNTKSATIFAQGTDTSSSINSANFYVGAANFSGYYYPGKIAFAQIGDGLTDTQASNFYTAVQAFQTTLARQVV